MKPINALGVGLALAGALFAAPAQAQTRTFVSASGSDSNACSFAAPCRSLQHAHDVVVAGGEIEVLDPTGYGSLTINKTITIYGHGHAHIVVPNGGKGVYVNAGASDTVTLRGLVIDGGGTGLDGINSQNVGSLSVADCEILGLTGSGIFVTGGTPTNLVVSNTRISNAQLGIYVLPSSLFSNSTLTRVEVNNTQNGITLQSTNMQNFGPMTSTIKDSVVSNFSNVGIHVNGDNNFAMVTSTAISNSRPVSAYALLAEDVGGATIIFLSRSTVTAAIPIYAALGNAYVCSSGDNYAFPEPTFSTGCYGYR